MAKFGESSKGDLQTHAAASAPPASSFPPPAKICESPRPPLEAHVLVDHLCLTERGTPVRSILPQWYPGSDHLEAPVPVTAHRGKETSFSLSFGFGLKQSTPSWISAPM